MQTWFDLFENFLAVERYDFCFIIRQRPVRSYGGDESFAGIRETVECFGMLHGTSMIVVVPHQPSGISGQLTTRHRRIGVQSMVNRMNRLLGCSLAAGLQGRTKSLIRPLASCLVSFPTQLAGFHQARWLIAVSDYVCMQSDRLVTRANRMSVEKSALREFNSRALDLSHKGSDCLMSAP